MPSVTVVTPVHNKWELTANCLRRLAEFTTDIYVTVVDNASTDDTPKHCEALGRDLFAQDFRYLRFEENRNFGPASNAGAQQADTDLLLFLNNDTLVTENWLPPLLAALENNPQLAGVGPLLLYPDKTVQHLGVAILPTGSLHHLYAGLNGSHPLACKRRRFPLITAAALLLPRRKFLDVGGFYEEFRNGFEDVDLGLKLTQHGGYMSVIPESTVYHLESQTIGRHDTESHNTQVLNSRWNMAKFSNLVHLAMADGYEVRIDPNLMAVLDLPKTKQRECLTAVRRPFDPSAMLAKLAEEPFWEQGYELLSEYLLAKDLAVDAFSLLSYGFRLLQSWSLLERIVAAGAKTRLQSEGLSGYQRIVDFYRKNRQFMQDEAVYNRYLDDCVHRLSGSDSRAMEARYLQAAEAAAVLRAKWRTEG